MPDENFIPPEPPQDGGNWVWNADTQAYEPAPPPAPDVPPPAPPKPPEEPIGTPTHGGNWRWDVPTQAFVRAD